MEKNKRLLNIIILCLSAIVFVLLLYVLFFHNREINIREIEFKIIDHDVKIKIDEIKKIDYVLNNSDSKIEWESSNDSIIVNSNGEISAKGYGQATITGTINDDEKIVDSCIVTAYSGDINKKLSSVDINEGSIVMKPNSEFVIPLIIEPNDAYLTLVRYKIMDENIATIDNNRIISKSEGTTSLKIWVSDKNNLEATFFVIMDVIVSNKASNNQILKKPEKVIIKDGKDLSMEIGNSMVLQYDVSPIDSYIYDVKWYSYDSDIVSVNNGEIKANKVGKTVINLTINGEIKTSINVNVNPSNSEIKIDNYPKTTIKVGERTNILAHIEPSSDSEKIIYETSNSKIVIVDDGIITGISNGTANIILSLDNGKKQSVTVNVLPRNGSYTGSQYLWGYKSLNSKVPVLADITFFQKLASSGIGILQGNKYLISNSEDKYTYDISSNMLIVNNKKIKVRIYYPLGYDLSTLNTLTFMGGSGEANFSGYFDIISKNPSIIKSGGIVALIAEGNNTSFDGDAGAYTTMFIKAITKQKSGVKNSILGFSDGAHKVMHASNKVIYDKIIVFSGYTDGVASLNNAKNSEVIFIIAKSDGNYKQAQTALLNMKNSGYNNVTVISNGDDMSKLFSEKFLVINPKTLMKNGHLTENVTLSGIIEYAND